MNIDQVSESDIELENKEFSNKPLSFEKQVGFPYHELQPRDFERLAYCLYKKEIEGNENIDYDEVQLMQGVGERGRDCILLKNGATVGVIQCKRHKTNLDRGQVGKEIVKLLLHYSQDTNLIDNLNGFEYTMVVAYGFSEKALDLINSINANNYDKDEIESWAIEVIKKTESLKTVAFDSIKDIVFDALNEMKFIKSTPDNINLLIEKYSEIKSIFFEMKVILDTNSFERLLIEREKEKVELLCNSSKLERALEQKNKHLYGRVQKTKQVVEGLINEYSSNFILYTNHTKKHTVDASEILGNKVMDKIDLEYLNEYELYVLSAASYLHDIGICRPNEDIEERYIEKSNGYNHLEFDEYIRELHPCLTYEFIQNEWGLLGLEEKWKDAIALVAGRSSKLDIFGHDHFEYSPDGGRDKVCIPYLHALVQLADFVDIDNINANYLLRNYNEMEEYKLSKKIWEESNNFVTCKVSDENRLLFEGNCDDQLIFIALNRHIRILKETLEQLNSKVRKYRSYYKFSISIIEEKIETPYGNKIGFTIDHNGIAETLIGKNIYRDEFDAIREVIQNSIDSCVFKQKSSTTYNPQIEVELTDSDVIVRDNGLGMDEYIIGNYFSKLCKSYYADYGIDSIGQFGIGVFSYFMLCDSFTVETKTEGREAMKFTAYKNLRSYFYFHEESSSLKDEGTTIYLHLKDEILEKVSFSKLVSKIEDCFRFLDIPITIRCGESSNVVQKKGFELDKKTELSDRLRYEERHRIGQLRILTSYSDNDDFEGSCGLVFENSDSYDYQPTDIREIFDSSSRNHLLICQNGIKIFEESTPSNSYLFINIVGKINIKKKLDLVLSRNSFRDNNLRKILFEFEKDLLNKFLDNIGKYGPKEAYNLNTRFVLDYFKGSRFPYKELQESVMRQFYVQIFHHNKTKHMTLGEFLGISKKFALMGGRRVNASKVKAISNYVDIPIVFIEASRFCNFYYRFFRYMNYKLTIESEYKILIG